MTVPRLTLRSVELRPVSVPLKRPIISKVGLFDRWPLMLRDKQDENSASIRMRKCRRVRDGRRA